MGVFLNLLCHQLLGQKVTATHHDIVSYVKSPTAELSVRLRKKRNWTWGSLESMRPILKSHAKVTKIDQNTFYRMENLDSAKRLFNCLWMNLISWLFKVILRRGPNLFSELSGSANHLDCCFCLFKPLVRRCLLSFVPCISFIWLFWPHDICIYKISTHLFLSDGQTFISLSLNGKPRFPNCMCCQYKCN